MVYVPVCVPVCLLVMTVSSAKTAEPIVSVQEHLAASLKC